jgi:hypothetical protein
MVALRETCAPARNITPVVQPETNHFTDRAMAANEVKNGRETCKVMGENVYY